MIEQEGGMKIKREVHTCVECKHFHMISNMATGICTKGQGYKEATAQGLPIPKKGQAYRQWYDFTCEEYEAGIETSSKSGNTNRSKK